MFYGEETIVDIARSFLDTNGVKQEMNATIEDNYDGYFERDDEFSKDYLAKGDFIGALKAELNRLDVCSQKGMGETFDGSIGAASVFMPFGGKTQLTPSVVMASKPPVSGFTHTVTASSYACYPRLMTHSPFTGAIYSIVTAVSKLVSAGVKKETIYLSLQEFFKRLGADPVRWGEPLSALLGALSAQIGLKAGAIGGKDSMSGTFENIDVPPTVIAFACGITDDRKIVHNVFDCEGKLYLMPLKRDEYGYPDFDYALKAYDEFNKLVENGSVARSSVTEEGGYATAIAKSLIGSLYGAKLNADEKLFRPLYGDIIVLAKEDLNSEFLVEIGEVNASGVMEIGGEKVETKALIEPFTSRLEKVYPTTAPANGEAKASSYESKNIYIGSFKTAKPRVFIPAFPGTNCEYDMAKAFTREGAEADIFVMRNITENDIAESIAEMKKRIDNAQIIAFPGGFSGGDEPDGSGKFIVNTFKNELLREAVEKLLYERDGLAIGICNGFQALIKLGLLPDGKISDRTENDPTLTYNNISRHVSTMVNVRIGTNKSPWLTGFKVGDIYGVPVSHGEGKFVCDPEVFEKLYANGQIATQYVDDNGKVTMLSPFNPNGSYMGVEGIISPDGRVLGKMGHTERYQKGLYQNNDGNFDMNLFACGVKYFK
jgi:phosphoribosylformylglycinamidine synthase